MWHDIEIGRLHEASKSRRSGYLDAVMKAAGQYGPPREVEGKVYVRIHQVDHDEITEKFNPAASIIRGATVKKGFGDKVHSIFGPIGRAIHWPCLKGDGTMDLKPGSPCDKARKLLNKL